MRLCSRLQTEDNLLLITLNEPIGTEQRAALAQAVDQLVGEHRPAGLVFTLGPVAGTAAVVSVILRTYRHRAKTGLPMAVATPPAAVRYLIRANQPALPVHTDTDDALSAVRAPVRRQAGVDGPRAVTPETTGTAVTEHRAAGQRA
ncbi:hypothetical protein OHA91_00925 [Streptomyces erythrochromogenes]|uniref:STAS domain-containing protein n=1 Tax=Streptomyces erythrochromogenes TaxID=285574 RepID=A0ABZ1Q3U2_9ACTN|nr:hypothetical protein [Streptomyces erythrochromogenes]